MANASRSNTSQRASETRLYTLTIDDGVAPCAPTPTGNSPALLTLAICKPKLREFMQARDVIMGLAGVEIEKQQRKKQGKKQGYSRNCIIYYAIIDIIDQVMPGKDYYTNTWAHRLDCIYRHDQSSGDFARIPSTTIHAELQDQEKDIGGDSAKVLMCRDFRYFGKDAVEVPDSRDFDLLRPIFQSGRGDPVLRNEGEIGRQLERLHQHLWSKQTKYTPTTLDANGPRRCRRDEGTDGDEEGAGKEAEGNGLAAQRSHKC